MRRIRLTVAYDGTNYHGWQVQPGVTTIESVLNDALTDLFQEKIAVIGASRTDSGVHARGNIAVFDTDRPMAADRICFALNQRLPEDIRVQESREVPPDWHPRKHRCVKTYEYRILNRRMELPDQRLYTYFYYYNLDLERMRKGASYLVGEHDFKSFCSAKTQAEDTVRTIYSLDITRSWEDVVTLRITGSGFLYNMVRIIAGTLLDVGNGHLEPEKVGEILESRDRRNAGPTAPAKGLTLMGMEYEDEALWGGPA